MAKENENTVKENEDELVEDLEAEEVPEEEGEEEQEEQRDGSLEALKALEKKYDELNDKYLRLYADFDNYKKRSTKERSDALNYAAAPVMEKLLVVLDNFERALTSCEEDTPFAEGVRMVSKQLSDILTSEGLSPIESVDSVFDPLMHNAVMVDADETKEDNIVTAELQKGYRYKDRVIRPSMVKVNKLK
ncbi:MAG: nucleotide exchange factor GrpE [Eubacteriaceae bacterium]|nr:nucleotide exchange factor GrpE [Eubacteriaceae bacterium]